MAACAWALFPHAEWMTDRQGAIDQGKARMRSLETQAEAIREQALAYDEQRWTTQHSWLGRLWRGNEALDEAREALLDDIQAFVEHGGSPDIAIPMARDGKPARMVPLLEFFLADRDSLDLAETMLHLGATVDDTAVRKMGRLALDMAPTDVPPLFERMLEIMVRVPHLNWRQVIRAEVRPGGGYHGRDMRIDTALEQVCPRFRQILGWAREAMGEPAEFLAYPSEMTPAQASSALAGLITNAQPQEAVSRDERLQRVRELLHLGADPETPVQILYEWEPPIQSRPLQVAAMELDAPLVALLMGHGAQVDETHAHVAICMARHALEETQASAMDPGKAQTQISEQLVATLEELRGRHPLRLDGIMHAYDKRLEPTGGGSLTPRTMLETHLP